MPTRMFHSGDWICTFVILTVPANELVAQIHDRMPLILPKTAYERWLGTEPDPHDLLVTFPAEPMTMWPISTRVNKPGERRRLAAGPSSLSPKPGEMELGGRPNVEPAASQLHALLARCKTNARP